MVSRGIVLPVSRLGPLLLGSSLLLVACEEDGGVDCNDETVTNVLQCVANEGQTSGTQPTSGQTDGSSTGDTTTGAPTSSTGADTDTETGTETDGPATGSGSTGS